ncbi:VRR-NUC domain-containing protein [Paraburkholderia bryophila]|uniref:VRR-NUC domain-containing protein n=1 Tax=Paraburkholderia bryophila TaxID=420952 RepID=A0A329BUQ9_9BURK|nr:VRR-NUC domain-containing protein [Paraburkholderia bryophila]RAS25788.1 VRR-NUC domain-containing protein [Paraburkholderia bryophila]
MGASLEEGGSTCTTIDEKPEYARIPPGRKGYLQEKVEHALQMPKIVYIRLPDGRTTVNLLKQVAMTLAIRYDENRNLDNKANKFLWQYKAEVSFDMWPTAISRGAEAPIPFLSDEPLGPGGQRHSVNPFPQGRKPKFLRRPDVIIVKNPADRWPGRGNVDRVGVSHRDNMLRLVEVKFPGDTWGEGQEEAYRMIAGDFKNRMTVIDVSDCNRELEKARQRALANAPALQSTKGRQRRRVPIRTIAPVTEPVWYEDWWSSAERHVEDVAEAVAPIWDAVHRGYTYLSEETSAFLHEQAPWIFTVGQWVEDKASDAWVWVDEKRQEIYRYTMEQLQAGWHEIVRTTDMTWELLKQIDWAQVAITTLKVLAAIVVVVAGVAIVVLLAPVLVAMFTALATIVSAASAEALAALALALGATVSASAG